MTVLTHSQQMRLHEELSLTGAEMAILVAVYEADDAAARDDVRAAAMSHGYSSEGRSFDVLLCRLNKKLPAGIRAAPVYPGGGQRYDGGTQRAIGYRLAGEFAREHIMTLSGKMREAA